jgi:alpha-amylase/alpha-mannosidase (GH57 family)
MRHICIHGHFYQPPRENPWLEEIELQDSAYPYHDWNERITAECYAPNSAARTLDGENRILKIANNYARISFNFGPTLLQWLARHSPGVYRAVLAADRESQAKFSGHGSAMAQAYNHMIMPLANRRDKFTQIWWGLRDFEYRFGRKPEGMWLPETAVDMETLNMMAELGIRFTILAPNQASRVRPNGSRNWEDVSGSRIDPSTAYRVNLRSGRRMNVFFYDGPVSRAVAFEKLLIRGEYLAERLASAFADGRAWPQIVHIATDGETYGHHQHRGDMALAYVLEYIEKRDIARLTNYGEFLENHPPTHGAQIFENSSWSCIHGVERWRSNCGCCGGGQPGWSQEWRKPLRAALDWLRDTMAGSYADAARRLGVDPWAARNDYITVILDRSPESIERFFAANAQRQLSQSEKVRLLKLLEMQRHAMLMYTSCGWFFDDLSGIETVQVIQYAARALQLFGELFGRGLEPRFLELLERAKSNIPEMRDGRQVYEKLVRPKMVGLLSVAAHYAVSSLFEEYPAESRIFCYDVTQEDRVALSTGRVRLVLGKARSISAITRETERFTYGVLHLGEHQVSGGIRAFLSDAAYQQTAAALTEAFQGGDFAEIVRSVDRHFDSGTYSLKLLFHDEQRRIVRLILETRMALAEASYRQIYESDAVLMYFVRSLGMPLPSRFRMAADFILNTDLCRALECRPLDLVRIRAMVEETTRLGVEVDGATLEFALRRTIEAIAAEFALNPRELKLMEEFTAAVDLARSLPFEVQLWNAQNVWHDLLLSLYPKLADCVEWSGAFRALGRQLQFANVQ